MTKTVLERAEPEELEECCRRVAASSTREKPVSQSSKKMLDDVQAAFDTRRVLNCSKKELEQLLVAAGAETISDPATRARAREMSETMRQLLEARSRDRRSKLAPVAVILALAALLCSAVQAYLSRAAFSALGESAAETGDYIRATNRDVWTGDPRMDLTITEMARRAPTLSTGTLHAWWAGEQARQVQRLEALAKQEMLAGDRDGAMRSVKQADAIRSGIDTLASFEKPPQK